MEKPIPYSYLIGRYTRDVLGFVRRDEKDDPFLEEPGGKRTRLAGCRLPVRSRGGAKKAKRTLRTVPSAVDLGSYEAGKEVSGGGGCDTTLPGVPEQLLGRRRLAVDLASTATSVRLLAVSPTGGGYDVRAALGA